MTLADKSLKRGEESKTPSPCHLTQRVFSSTRPSAGGEPSCDEREAAARQLQRLSTLGLLTGGVAHDFNNILTTIMGNASLIEAELGHGSTASPFVDRITDACNNAQSICRSLLSYTSKKRQPNQSVDICKLTRETLKLSEVLLRPRARVNANGIADCICTEGDPAQLRQVLLNLLVNASEAIERPPGEISVSTKLVQFDGPTAAVGGDIAPGEWLELVVGDNGIGMTDAMVARIFDPHFTTKPNGTGLGLYITLGILRDHRAHLVCESKPGKGTLMKLYFLPSATPEA